MIFYYFVLVGNFLERKVNGSKLLSAEESKVRNIYYKLVRVAATTSSF